MTSSRARAVIRLTRGASPAKLHDLYMEVYGAEFTKLTLERARESIVEACEELLDRAPALRSPPRAGVEVQDPPEPAVEPAEGLCRVSAASAVRTPCAVVPVDDDLPLPPLGIL